MAAGLLKDHYGFCVAGFSQCAKRLYEETPRKSWTEPRTEFQYLSGHLQFAGAMAVAASNKTIEELFDHYLYKRVRSGCTLASFARGSVELIGSVTDTLQFNMTLTSYGPEAWNPSMAAGIVSTGQDFEHMLHSLLTYTGLPKEVCEQMETDWTKAPVNPSGDGWFGHYGFGHVCLTCHSHAFCL